jgi:hypothetical protein
LGSAIQTIYAAKQHVGGIVIGTRKGSDFFRGFGVFRGPSAHSVRALGDLAKGFLGQLALTGRTLRRKSPASVRGWLAAERSNTPLNEITSMKKLLLSLLSAGILSLGAVSMFAQADQKEKKGKKKQAAATTEGSATAPKTLIHVVTVAFKEGTTPEQINAALDGAHKLPAAFPGITRVWTKTVKAQGNRTHAIVMEFTGEQALKEYAGSDAQKEWYKVYEAIREASTTFDITN